MIQKEEWKKSIKNEIEQCNDYLKNAKDISDFSTNIEEKKKDAEAKLLFVEGMPESILTELGGTLFTNQKSDEEQLKLHIPGLPSINSESRRYFTYGTSDSSAYYEIVHAICLPSEHSSTRWAFSQIEIESIDTVNKAYSELAEDKAKRQNLPPLLDKIKYKLGDEFLVTINNYDKAKSRIVGIDQSAIQMRDVIEHLWGGLVNLARTVGPPKYNDVKLKIDQKGKMIVVNCIISDVIEKRKLILLLDNLSNIKSEISDSNFGKNPLTDDMNKLEDIYHRWILVISDIAYFLYFHRLLPQ